MSVSISNITIILAFLLPGAIAMWGASRFSTTVRGWLVSPRDAGASLGGAVLFLVASLVAGLLADAVRIHTIDNMHYITGVDQAAFTFDQLDGENTELFQGIMDNHYRYHQFYGNGFLCIVFAYVAYLAASKKWPWQRSWHELLGVAALLFVTWLGSRTDLDAASAALSELLQ